MLSCNIVASSRGITRRGPRVAEYAFPIHRTTAGVVPCYRPNPPREPGQGDPLWLPHSPHLRARLSPTVTTTHVSGHGYGRAPPSPSPRVSSWQGPSLAQPQSQPEPEPVSSWTNSIGGPPGTVGDALSKLLERNHGHPLPGRTVFIWVEESCNWMQKNMNFCFYYLFRWQFYLKRLIVIVVLVIIVIEIERSDITKHGVSHRARECLQEWWEHRAILYLLFELQLAATRSCFNNGT